MEERDWEYFKNSERELAREYFKPLSYANISKVAWRMLITILEKHVANRNKAELSKPETERSYTYEIDKCVWNKPTKRKAWSSYIKVKLDDFVVREGISFNPDGFIGFAGWADSYNTRLFTDAFREWVDWMKGAENVTN